MSDENNNEEKSYIYIEFDGIGSVDIKISQFEQVTAFQLLAMAHLLEFEGKGALAIEKAARFEAQQHQPKIVVPVGKGSV